ncbi:MAG: hypothetical protein M3422_16155 [Actinomycetota bacterium]|nr:hypothetical protein [Actinomycetota bacterium]
MTSENRIVQDAERNAAGPSPLEGAGMAQDLFDAQAKILSGDWTEGLFNLGSGLLDANRFRNEDPLAVLLSMGFGWLIEYIGWLREPLDWLAGEQQELDVVAGTWTGISDEMNQAADDLESAYKTDAQGWRGPAADAYRSFCTSRVELYRGVAAGASAMSGLITIGKVVVAVVRSIIRNLVADFAGKLVSLMLRFPPPTTAAAIPEAIKSATGFWPTVREWLVKLKRVLGRGGEMADNLRKHLMKAAKNLKDTHEHAARVMRQGRKLGDGLLRQGAEYARHTYYGMKREAVNGLGTWAGHVAASGMGEKLIVESTKEAGKYVTGQVDKALDPETRTEAPEQQESYLNDGPGPHRVSGDLS